MSNYWLLMLLAVPLIGSLVTMILQPEVAHNGAVHIDRHLPDLLRCCNATE